ncbi:MAG: iron-containing redox enzyme family protein [Candidatus Thermoplasmatota archaeon]|jgi:pyrroloquinoline quinone (PQQ) biosynthesis protein C|nr:iron-containing redox enzyme family protein [Candidatus Thermoplasmatota archaeon]MCL5786330.1 iron-containing redox enzyme family protein [Candidatus Thermoplasmatota archaeon]
MQKINEKDFYRKAYNFVKDHPATNNDFINRFSRGEVTESEFLRFSLEFYHFTREWPSILSTLLVNTPDESDAANLTNILVSELGDMDPTKRHELLYRKYLRSLGFIPEDLVKRRQIKTTKEWLDGMRTYFSGEHFAALGAEFGLENMAIPMWDKILAGFQAWFKEHPKYANADIEYFTFHREIEIHHEEAMEDVLGSHKDDASIQKSFMSGIDGILNRERDFWLGLSDKSN